MHNRERVPLRLFEHIKDNDVRKTLKLQYLATKDILDQTIRRTVQKKIDASIAEEEDPKKYEIAAWRDRDADHIGYRRALREILKLLP